MRAGAEPQWDEAQSSGPEFEIDIREHLKILRKRMWLIGGIALAVVALGVVYLAITPRVYRATASIIIESSNPRVLGDQSDSVDFGPGDYWSNKEYFETQYKILSSREVLSRVVEKKGLARDLDFLGVAKIEDVEKRAEKLEKIDPVEVLSKAMRVEPVKNSQLAQIVVEDENPARAAELANAIVEAYTESNLDRRQDGTRAASQWLAEQMQDLKGKLETSEIELYNFRKDNDILATSIEDRQSINSRRLVALNESLTKVIGQRVELEAALVEVDRTEKTSKVQDAFWALQLGRVATHPTVSKLREELAKQEADAAALAERYLEQHPQRLAAQERLAKLRSQLQTELTNVVSSLRSQYREVKTTEAQLTELIDGLKREAFEINKREIDQRRLEREAENNRRLYDLVLSRLKDSDLAVMLKANNVRLLDRAQEPNIPVKPRPALVLALSLLLGTLGGVGAAYLAEMLDNTLKQEEDIEQVLQLPFLGLVPTVAAAGISAAREEDTARDLYAARNTRSSQAEAFRSIRTNLLFMATDKSLKRILVTSSAPQEGKSMTSIGIGSTMASAGNRVLIIDTDMRRPRLHRSLGVSNEVGISTLLLGETSIDDAVKTTEVANLYMLPCGPVPPNPGELIHTERFKQLLDKLNEKFDLVILDSPPLLAASDAAVLSTLVDGVVYVTRFKKTTKDLAQRMIRGLRDVNAPILGAVLNDVNLESRAYGYYAYKRYGYYGDTPAS